MLRPVVPGAKFICGTLRKFDFGHFNNGQNRQWVKSIVGQSDCGKRRTTDKPTVRDITVERSDTESPGQGKCELRLLVMRKIYQQHSKTVQFIQNFMFHNYPCDRC